MYSKVNLRSRYGLEPESKLDVFRSKEQQRNGCQVIYSSRGFGWYKESMVVVMTSDTFFIVIVLVRHSLTVCCLVLRPSCNGFLTR